LQSKENVFAPEFARIEVELKQAESNAS